MKLRLSQVRKGMCKAYQSTTDISEELLDRVQSYFLRNGGVYREGDEYRVKSPLLESLVKELHTRFGIEFMEEKAQRVE